MEKFNYYIVIRVDSGYTWKIVGNVSDLNDPQGIIELYNTLPTMFPKELKKDGFVITNWIKLK